MFSHKRTGSVLHDASPRLLDLPSTTKKSKPQNEHPMKIYMRLSPSSNVPASIDVNPELFNIDLEDNSITVARSEDSSVTKDDTNNIKFQFSQVFDQTGSQQEVMRLICVPILRDVLSQNKSGLMINYGGASWGKHYTLFGTVANPGLVPRSLKAMMDIRKRVVQGVEENTRRMALKESGSPIHNDNGSDGLFTINGERILEFRVFFEAYDIYGDEINDLLKRDKNSNASRQKLQIKEKDNQRVFIKDLNTVEITSEQQATAYLSRCQSVFEEDEATPEKERSKAHTVYRLIIKTVKKCPTINTVLVFKGSSKQYTTTSLCFVSLGWPDKLKKGEGSESQGKTSEPSAGQYTTKSLNALSKCLRDLKEVREGQNIHSSGNTWTGTPGRQPVYKDYKLTRILYEYFYENTNIRFMSHLNVAPFDHDEAFRTISYTNQIKGSSTQSNSRMNSVSKIGKDTTYRLVFPNGESNQNSVTKLLAGEHYSAFGHSEAVDNLKAFEGLQPSILRDRINGTLSGSKQVEPAQAPQTVNLEEIKISMDENSVQYNLKKTPEEHEFNAVNVTFAEHQFAGAEDETGKRSGTGKKSGKRSNVLEEKVIEQDWYTQSAACPDQEASMCENNINASLPKISAFTTSFDRPFSSQNTSSQDEKIYLSQGLSGSFERLISSHNTTLQQEILNFSRDNLEDSKTMPNQISLEQKVNISEQKVNASEYHAAIPENSNIMQQEVTLSEHIPDPILGQSLFESQQNSSGVQQQKEASGDQSETKSMLDHSFIGGDENIPDEDIEADVQEEVIASQSINILQMSQATSSKEVAIASEQYLANSQDSTKANDQNANVLGQLFNSVDKATVAIEQQADVVITKVQEVKTTTVEIVRVLPQNLLTDELAFSTEQNNVVLESQNKNSSNVNENAIAVEEQAVNTEQLRSSNQPEAMDVEHVETIDEDKNTAVAVDAQGHNQIQETTTTNEANNKAQRETNIVDLEAQSIRKETCVIEIEDDTPNKRLTRSDDVEILSERAPEENNRMHVNESFADPNITVEAVSKETTQEIMAQKPEVRQKENVIPPLVQQSQFVYDSPAFRTGNHEPRDKAHVSLVTTDKPVEIQINREFNRADLEKDARIQALEDMVQKLQAQIYMNSFNPTGTMTPMNMMNQTNSANPMNPMNSMNNQMNLINENFQSALKNILNPQSSINKPNFPFAGNDWILQGHLGSNSENPSTAHLGGPHQTSLSPMMMPVNVNYYVFQGAGQAPQISTLGDDFRENVSRIVRTNNPSVMRMSVRKNDGLLTASKDLIEMSSPYEADVSEVPFDRLRSSVARRKRGRPSKKSREESNFRWIVIDDDEPNLKMEAEDHYYEVQEVRSSAKRAKNTKGRRKAKVEPVEVEVEVEVEAEPEGKVTPIAGRTRARKNNKKVKRN